VHCKPFSLLIYHVAMAAAFFQDVNGISLSKQLPNLESAVSKYHSLWSLFSHVWKLKMSALYRTDIVHQDLVHKVVAVVPTHRLVFM